MVVATGGVGDIGLGAVNGYPPIGETLGTNKSFHYVIRAVNNTPLEAGVGVMTDVITLRRDNVYAKMLNGVYSAGDGLTNLSIPVGAFLYTADTKEMLEDLQLELPLRDYGNVSGATGVDLRNSAIKLNLTANATLTFSEPPPVGVKAEITLHATSANAGTADFGKGYVLTLPVSCKLGKNNCPPIPLTHDTETVLTLTTTNGGTSYQVHWQNQDTNINDLGDIAETASMTLDIRYTQTRARFVSETEATFTVSGVSPAALLGEPAHFSFVNDGSITKTIAFNTEAFTLIGSNLNSVSVPIGYKADFTIRKNPNANDADPAYDVWVNGINYNQSASGLATTFNPSDYFGTPPLLLSEDSRTISMTVLTAAIRSARAFGGKNAGKWYYSLRCDEDTSNNNTTSLAVVAFGIASLSASLSNQFVGQVVNSASLYINLGNGNAVTARTYDDGTLTTRTTTRPLAGGIYTLLFNANTGNGWIVLNGVVLFGGNPEAGTGAHFNVNYAVTYYPMISLQEAHATSNAGVWTLLSEVLTEDIQINFPSWAGRYWTA